MVDYCELEVELDRFSGTLPEAAPSLLLESSIVLEGTRSDGTRFIVYTDDDQELEFEARDGFTVSDPMNNWIVGVKRCGAV